MRPMVAKKNIHSAAIGRPRSVEQFNHYLAVCQQRGMAVSEAHIDGSKFVLKFVGHEASDLSNTEVLPIDLVKWGKA